MIRENLTEAIKEAVERCDYTFMCGSKERMARQITKLPVAWLSTVEITGVEGRNEGVITYGVTLNLIDLDHRYSEEQKEQVWAMMEQHAIRIYNHLCYDNRVKTISNLKCKPNQRVYTPSAELSLEMSFNAEMFFCREDY